MKKFFLVLFIIACGTFIYLKVQVSGNPQSNFNQTTRYTLGKYEILRYILGLHNYGDARNSYLGGNGNIIVEVVQAQGTHLDERVIKNFTDDIQNYTGKNVNLVNAESFPQGTLTDADVANVVSGYRHHLVFGDPNLFVIYSNDFKRDGDEVGKTVSEFGIMLSDKRLKEVTADYPGSLPQYTESTLLHEFGHQMGLEHNNKPDCIMNERAEKPAALGFYTGNYTITKFCDFELNELQALEAQSNK